jgi:tetratricopeptide (TPR) repeat protein
VLRQAWRDALDATGRNTQHATRNTECAASARSSLPQTVGAIQLARMSKPRLVCLALVVITLATFFGVRHFDFTNYDDPEYVTRNPQITRGLSLEGIRWAFSTFHISNWHPVTWLSHMLDCELFGLDAGAHHVVNLILHLLNTVLLFLLLWRLTGEVWPAAFVAALFGWHPQHVESVVWIAERKDLLSGFFGLLAMHAYAGWVRDRRRGQFALLVAMFVLGLMAKPMLVTLPFVLLLLDYWPLGRMKAGRTPAAAQGLPLPRLLAEKWVLFAATFALCAVTLAAQRGEAVRTVQEVSLGSRFGNALVSYVAYLVKTFWPVDLAVFYPLRREVPMVEGLLALVALGGISFAVWKLRASRPYLLVGWLWFVGMLVPVIGLVQVGGQARADRYTYLPLIGVFIMLAWGGRDFIRVFRVPAKLAAVVSAVLLIACSALTRLQAGHWRNSEILFRHALEVMPENAVAHINLGSVFEQAGRMDEAQAHYREALRIDPGRAQAHNNLANVLDAAGKFAEAVPHYEEAIRLRPRESIPRNHFGMALAGQGRFDEALSNYAAAMALAPRDPLPHYLSGVALLKQGQTARAIESFRVALRLDPNHAKALDRLARVLSCTTDATVRDGAEAIRLATRAAELTGWQQPGVLDTLASAHAEAGHFEDAVKVLQSAIELLNQNGAASEARNLEPHLQSFQNRQPWREDFTSDGPAR